MSSVLRRTLPKLARTSRYTDGSGRALESNVIPMDPHLPAMSNRAYPVQREIWQPIHSVPAVSSPSNVALPAPVEIAVTPHKGKAFISGAGVVGLTTAILFGLRGWHTTVLESASPLSSLPEATPLWERMAEQAPPTPSPSPSPFFDITCALVNRRAADVLSVAGVSRSTLRACGVVVSGVMDHPGAFHTWWTKSLVELHPFATNVLAVDLLKLRKWVEKEASQQSNVKVFYNHRIEAAYPLKKEIVVKPIRNTPSSESAGMEGSALEASVSTANSLVTTLKHTSLALSPMKWAKQYAAQAVEYDLLISAEGANSRLRDLLDVEGFSTDVDCGVRWFVLQTTRSVLSASHIHRWIHTCEAGTTPLSFSSQRVSLTVAFPRMDVHPTDPEVAYFSVMAYMPSVTLSRVADDEFLETYMHDIWKAKDPRTKLVSFEKSVLPAPTVFCENLYNSVGLPSAVLVGDAAHTSHPFWMQQLPLGLEDGLHLLQLVDACSHNIFDAIKQYSDERGVSGDSLRELTERCLYYQRNKHRNPFLRLRNEYQRWMYRRTPAKVNTLYEGSTNHLYSRSIEEMLNGSGYTSFEYAEKQQAKHRMFYHLGRIYT